ncbi:MAG: hypothetical protein AB7O59_13190 [Pirellulales bacterium]
MHTVERLEQAIALAERLGFVVRQEWLGGVSAGGCEVRGRRWLFVDLALSPAEQLEQVLAALRDISPPSDAAIAFPELPNLLKLPRAA